MTQIKLYNTLAREKQDFTPIDPTNVRVYVCGPTVYDYAHIGNARPVVVFDTLFRLLRHVYGADHVTYARNFTDIDDKIMKRADEEGVSIKAITKKYSDVYESDMGALNNLTPSLQPRATDHIPEMIKMMRTLIEKGHAYEAEGHVLFNVASMEGYGALSRHSRDELVAGARVEVASFKKDPADFVLWKPSSDEQVGWGSPWGRGRPGWHLECSCMIEKHMGKTIDIHGGGQDLIFPHHENEIAQSECSHGVVLANYWVHNGYLTVDGTKMSKSLGNFHTVHDLIKDHKGEALRMSLLNAHYRQPVDFSTKSVNEQKERLDYWYRVIENVTEVGDVPQALIEALSDDLNTPKALSVLDALAKSGNASELMAGGQFMGVLNETYSKWFQSFTDDQLRWVVANRQRYEDARAEKNFQLSDIIRDEAWEKGIAVEVGKDGVIWKNRVITGSAALRADPANMSANSKVTEE